MLLIILTQILTIMSIMPAIQIINNK